MEEFRRAFRQVYEVPLVQKSIDSLNIVWFNWLHLVGTRGDRSVPACLYLLLRGTCSWQGQDAVVRAA